jgi:hypothetical protein
MDEDILLAIARCDRYLTESPSSISNVVCYANALTKKVGVFVGDLDTTHNEALLREGANIFKLTDEMVETLITELRTNPADTP